MLGGEQPSAEIRGYQKAHGSTWVNYNLFFNNFTGGPPSTMWYFLPAAGLSGLRRDFSASKRAYKKKLFENLNKNSIDLDNVVDTTVLGYCILRLCECAFDQSAHA